MKTWIISIARQVSGTMLSQRKKFKNWSVQPAQSKVVEIAITLNTRPLQHKTKWVVHLILNFKGIWVSVEIVELMAQALDLVLAKPSTIKNFRKWTFCLAFTIWVTLASLIAFYSAWFTHEYFESTADLASTARIVSRTLQGTSLSNQLLSSLWRNLIKYPKFRPLWTRAPHSAHSASLSRISRALLRKRKMATCRCDL